MTTHYAKVVNASILDTTEDIKTVFPNVVFGDTLPASIENWYKVIGSKPELTLNQKITGHSYTLSNGIPQYSYTVENKTQAEITAYKKNLKNTVDSHAELIRLQYITGGAGQANVYREKYIEAVDYLAQGSNADINDYPHIKAEIGITGTDAEEVCNVVVGNRNAWIGISASIESKRLQAKKDIEDATTLTIAQGVFDDYITDNS